MDKVNDLERQIGIAGGNMSGTVSGSDMKKKYNYSGAGVSTPYR